MLISSSVSAFPARRLLRRFFRAGRPALIPLEDAAELLGMTTDQAGAIADREGMLSWEEAAHQLFLAWPRRELLDALGADAQDHIPTLFFPMPLQLHLPLYLHLAMQHQAAGRGIHDYITDVLHVAVDDRTLHAFRDNGPFLDAFHYPVLRSEAGVARV